MKFSIITPVHAFDAYRLKQFYRAIDSVEKQTVQDFEHIVIDDGSVIPLTGFKGKASIYTQPHLERIVAYNNGLSEAKGEWICFLDSDDEYVSYYLEAVQAMIEKYPEYKMFNFGSIHITLDYKANPRNAFRPKMEKVGHEVFGTGTIVNGTFVFHRSIYEKLGAYPETSSPWDLSTMAQEEFPEIKPLFTVVLPDHPKGFPRELGNPWGNDYYLFYKYTRKYHSMPVDAHLYMVHPSRKEHTL